MRASADNEDESDEKATMKIFLSAPPTAGAFATFDYESAFQSLNGCLDTISLDV